MNTKKLKEAEDYFFELYPKGVEDENLLPIIKKHNTAKIGQTVQEMFVKDNFATPKLICENFSKIVSKSTLVSIFEKPKVRDMVKRMSIEQEDMLSIGLYELLYGNKSSGFDILVNVLAHYGLAKWSLVTLIPYYYARNKEFFIKPNTTKNIIKFFELEGLVYKPRPSYEFYMQYKAQLEKMKSYINSGVGDDNAGFTGFLMIAMEE
ncbi:MAG: hypothetical protein PHI79_06130 [Sulfurovaceae bacterium]|nr:hypothetical protein [Sulfurovaceae bacterium]MDD5549157.1 hypothetical protein [Sulfurovaceae bacterium]